MTGTIRKILIANLILFPIVLAFTIYAVFKFNSFLNTKASNEHKGIYIEIKKNEPVLEIVKTLKAKGIITRSDWFYYYLRLSGQAHRIKAGYHFFFKDYTPKQVLDELVNPKLHPVKVTIIPGFSLKYVEKIIRKNNLDYANFKRLEHNKQFVKQCSSYPAETLEGFLYPDTYFIAKGERASVYLKLMCSRFMAVFKSITNRDNLTDDDYKKLIIASIVQREAKNEQDMKLVSSVIYNRIKKHMFLQMDSTRYTYTHKGLPPTPICNPSKAAILAAYKPDNSSFLYFISKKDGSMVFSKTLKEHNQNIRKYLK